MSRHEYCATCGDDRYLAEEDDGRWRCVYVSECLLRRLGIERRTTVSGTEGDPQ